MGMGVVRCCVLNKDEKDRERKRKYEVSGEGGINTVREEYLVCGCDFDCRY